MDPTGHEKTDQTRAWDHPVSARLLVPFSGILSSGSLGLEPTSGSGWRNVISRRPGRYRCGAMVPGTITFPRGFSTRCGPRRGDRGRWGQARHCWHGPGPRTNPRDDGPDPRGVLSKGTYVLICGSHTDHGPVIELTDQPVAARGNSTMRRPTPGNFQRDHRRDSRGRCDPSAGPPGELAPTRPDLEPQPPYSKRPEKPTDSGGLTVIRFLDGEDGSPLAVLVHYTAHPILTAEGVLKFSVDYPGSLKGMVEKELKVPCVFIQGAAGDQSPNPPAEKRDPRIYGELLGAEVLALTHSLTTAVPRRPSVAAKVNRFEFKSRVNFRSSITFLLYAQAFSRSWFKTLSRARRWSKARDHNRGTQR